MNRQRDNILMDAIAAAHAPISFRCAMATSHSDAPATSRALHRLMNAGAVSQLRVSGSRQSAFALVNWARKNSKNGIWAPPPTWRHDDIAATAAYTLADNFPDALRECEIHAEWPDSNGRSKLDDYMRRPDGLVFFRRTNCILAIEVELSRKTGEHRGWRALANAIIDRAHGRTKQITLGSSWPQPVKRTVVIAPAEYVDAIQGRLVEAAARRKVTPPLWLVWELDERWGFADLRCRIGDQSTDGRFEIWIPQVTSGKWPRDRKRAVTAADIAAQVGTVRRATEMEQCVKTDLDQVVPH